LQNPKFCGYYKFQKEYLDDLIDMKVFVIICEELEELEVVGVFPTGGHTNE
jgi:hypothetical protein